MNGTETFEEWLKSPEGKKSLATGEYTREYTREQGLRLAFLLGTPIAVHTKELQIDAERYRFIRDSDNWGEDSGDDSWETLTEATTTVFDEIIDSRMKMVNYQGT